MRDSEASAFLRRDDEDCVDGAVLSVGLGFNALLGWWWADPMAALALILFFIKEGRGAFGDST